MAFFNKMLATVGIGSANVDTKLEKSFYVAGEVIKGEVEVYGGNVEQQIAAIYLTLYTTYIKEVDDRKYTAKVPIQKNKVNEPFTIGINERKVIPFSFTLPVDSPVTIGNTRVWVATELAIRSGVDSDDKDYIEIRPGKIATKVFEEVQQLGFRLRKVECEQAPSKYRRHYPFIQEFEFVTTSGPFRGKLDELEITFLSQTEQAVDILMKVDRKARGLGGFLAEALDVDETHVRMTITQEELHHVRDMLSRTIAKYS